MSDSHLPSDGRVDGQVTAVSLCANHQLAKQPQDAIELLVGLGVQGDTHSGRTVQHRSRVARDPKQPNLRQVHLMASELHAELAAQGFQVAPGEMGENITTRGIDLIRLPLGTRLHFVGGAEIEITGLRNPCRQLDAWQPGLMAATLARDPEGKPILKAGIMGIVIQGGRIEARDTIRIAWPAQPHRPLERV